MNTAGAGSGGGASGGGVDEALHCLRAQVARWRRRGALSRTSPATWHGATRTQARMALAARQERSACFFVLRLAPVRRTARSPLRAAAMVVRIRLARFGRKNLPFYRIFVADSRSPRDGRHIEVVGHFDPITGARAGADERTRCMARGCGAAALLGVAAHSDARCERCERCAALTSLRAGKDGNKHLGLNFDRIKCVRAPRAPQRPRCAPGARLRAPTLTLLSALHGADAPLARLRRARYWLSVGAQPSDRVARLLGACEAPSSCAASRSAHATCDRLPCRRPSRRAADAASAVPGGEDRGAAASTHRAARRRRRSADRMSRRAAPDWRE